MIISMVRDCIYLQKLQQLSFDAIHHSVAQLRLQVGW